VRARGEGGLYIFPVRNASRARPSTPTRDARACPGGPSYKTSARPGGRERLPEPTGLPFRLPTTAAGEGTRNQTGAGEARPDGFRGGGAARVSEQAEAMDSIPWIHREEEHFCCRSSASKVTSSALFSPGGRSCEHYRRGCRVVAPCCGEVFGCRHCHNDAKVRPFRAVDFDRFPSFPQSASVRASSAAFGFG